MVAPLDPLRGPSTAPQTGAPRQAAGPADAFELEFQRLLQSSSSSSGAAASAATSTPSAGLADDDLTASLEGVSESLKRATAYINSARAYFKGAPAAPPPPVDGALDTRG